MSDEIRTSDVSIYTLREQVSMLSPARDCDLLHVPHYNVPVFHRGPLIATIHDLTHLTEPAFKNSAKSWMYARPMLHIAAKKAAHIITVSQFSKQEITERLKIPCEKVTVIYNGIDPNFRPTDRDEATRVVQMSLGIRQPYLLYVGNLKPHKNLGTLIRGFAQVHSQDSTLLLLLVGDDRRYRDRILALCRTLGLSDAVRQVPSVSEHLLHKIYLAAELLVMPSTNEGFGFPVLEAMASGTPVVSSNAAALPEIGGQAALYFDPSRPEELAAAIKQVVDSATLRADLRSKGLKQAARFSWKECAQKHVEIYRGVLHN